MKIKPIPGHQLLELMQNRTYKACIENVVLDLEDANERVTNILEAASGRRNHNLSTILQIRDILYDRLFGVPGLLNALMIVVPHTHWVGNKPIIYRFDQSNDRYIIGHHDVHLSEVYSPCSFIFTAFGPMPYEWFDSTISNFEKKDLNACFAIIESINREFIVQRWPFAINLNFRFKSDIKDYPVSTIELPIKNYGDPFYGFASIEKETNKKEVSGDVQQVAWHAISDKLFDLNEDELILLNRIRKYYSDLNESDKELCLEKLELLQ